MTDRLSFIQYIILWAKVYYGRLYAACDEFKQSVFPCYVNYQFLTKYLYVVSSFPSNVHKDFGSRADQVMTIAFTFYEVAVAFTASSIPSAWL